MRDRAEPRRFVFVFQPQVMAPFTDSQKRQRENPRDPSYGTYKALCFDYSQVPNKRISLIREYHEYFLIVVNEYHVINEYLGKSHDIHKRI